MWNSSCEGGPALRASDVSLIGEGSTYACTKEPRPLRMAVAGALCWASALDVDDPTVVGQAVIRRVGGGRRADLAVHDGGAGVRAGRRVDAPVLADAPVHPAAMLLDSQRDADGDSHHDQAEEDRDGDAEPVPVDPAPHQALTSTSESATRNVRPDIGCLPVTYFVPTRLTRSERAPIIQRSVPGSTSTETRNPSRRT